MNKEIKFSLEMLRRLPQKEPFIHYTEPRKKYKLQYCPYGACEMFKISNTLFLKSNEETRQFYINKLYSMTTRKHITYFLREVAGISSFVPYKKYVGKALIDSNNYEVEYIEEEK